MKARLLAFGHALRGAKTLVVTQPHAKFHAIATLAVVGLGLGCGVSVRDWALLVFAIAMVWIAEGLNTAIEFLADEVTLERRERIKHAKDIAACSVLVAAVAAVVVGLAVFFPYLKHRF